MLRNIIFKRNRLSTCIRNTTIVENIPIILIFTPLLLILHSKYLHVHLQMPPLSSCFLPTLNPPVACLYRIYPWHHLSAKSYCLRIWPLPIAFPIQFISQWISFLLLSRYHEFICLDLSTFIP
jgi:hypothetical protein